LKIDKSHSSVDYIFGTTRTRRFGSSSDTNENLYIFRLQTKGKTEHDLDDSSSSTVLMKQLEPDNFSDGSFVTGIYDTLEDSGN